MPNLVDLSGYCTNRPYLADIIDHSLQPGQVKIEEILDLYEKEGLSAAQIAAKLDVSKTFVLTKLKAAGVSFGNSPVRRTTPHNYRCPNAPYGYKKQAGRLVPNKAELRTCRLIVKLITDGWTTIAVARELARRQVKNRKDQVKWGHQTVNQIYKRWHGKL